MKWGPWTLNVEYLTLEHENGYDVSLSECHSSAAILDWIFQIHGKPWADAVALNGLLDALEDVLHPQANYCSMAQDRTADGAALARAYVANPNARADMYAMLTRRRNLRTANLPPSDKE